MDWIGWHLLLNATRATGFDVDAPIIGLSWEDVGSGVVALFATVLGDRADVWGAYVLDFGHGYYEIHPLYPEG